MSGVDWRRWLDVGAANGAHGAIALEVQADGRLRLALQVVPPYTIPAEPLRTVGEVLLDYSDAGLLLDWLREAVGVQLLLHGDGVAGAAVAGVQLAREHDTPPAGEGLSGPSASIRPRG